MIKSLMRVFNKGGKTKSHSPSVRAHSPLANPLVASLNGLLSSPNTDIYRTLKQTRQLSRWLCDNEPYASKYIELTVVYVTGDDGIQAHPELIGRRGSPLIKVSDAVKRHWESWGDDASLDGRFSFSELEQMAIQNVAKDGEAIFRIIRSGKSLNKYGFALQAIDPVLLDIDYNTTLHDGNSVIMGVERDRHGKPVAYHIWNRYYDERQGSLPRERNRIPSDEIIHIFDDATGTAVRGMPWTTPALGQLVRLMEWQDDYAAAMKLAARTRLVLHNESSDDELVDDSPDSAVATDAFTSAMMDRADITDFVNTSQSQIIEVEKGKHLEALNIASPQSGVAESAKLILQRIAAGLHVSYATLTSDGSKSSFSTVRHDSIVERDIWKNRQKWLIRVFHKRVFKEWLKQAVLTGAVVLPGDNTPSDVTVAFIPRGFSQIDLVKELKGYTQAIEQKLMSRTEVVAKMGGNFADVLKQIEAENKLAQQHGISFPEQASQQGTLDDILDVMQPNNE